MLFSYKENLNHEICRKTNRPRKKKTLLNEVTQKHKHHMFSPIVPSSKSSDEGIQHGVTMENRKV